MSEAKRQGSVHNSRSTQKASKLAPALFEHMESRVLFSLSPAAPVAEQAVNFTTGPSIADPARNVVYLVDATNRRLLAINTDTGGLTATATLANPAAGLAINQADDRIYVSEPGASTIEVFSIPSFTPQTALTTAAGYKQIVFGANNRLYGVVTGTNAVNQLNATTGAVLNTLITTYTNPILSTNFADTHLYVLDAGAAGIGSLPEYDISTGAAPTIITNLTVNRTNAKSLAVDEPSNHVYIANSGVDGIGVVNISANTESVASFGGPTSGVGVAAVQGIHYVYGASAGPLTATIRQFTFDTLTPVADYVLDASSPLKVTITTDSDSLRITPNGHVLFTGNSTVGAGLIGIIGVNSVSVASPTSVFAFKSLPGRYYTFNAIGSSAPANQKIVSYFYDFGDGTTSTDSTPTHTYTSNGTYTVKLTVVGSGGTSMTSSQVLSVFSANPSPTPTPPPTSGGAQIAGYIYNDLNGNGALNRGESTVRGFGVFLDTNRDGKYDGFEPFTTSGRRGTYLFSGLPAGSYNIGVILPSGWTQTFPTFAQEQTTDLHDGDLDYTENFLVYLSNARAYRRSLSAAATTAVRLNGTIASIATTSKSVASAMLKTNGNVLA